MIKLSVPHLAGNEKKYVDDAVESTWIVPLGPYVDEFEKRLETFLDTSEVVALSAGTAAIHLALVMAGVKSGDEVICQSLTFSASCNPIVYLGAKPVFVDSEPSTWNISPELLEEAIIDRKHATGHYPSAIVAVDLYGMPARMDEIKAVARKYSIPVVEDAAEALGSEYKGEKCCTLCLYGVLRFNGNKIITTSG
ncbi:MAG: aminotransferase class I/II-fold pyridoxal phosphate-dependent enzyme, partial [Muribaculaceae bacterium]|nr:aminotransferase class I/II-fold pyridoxal phosphate-dependent enzyme [Muribaculaceae bacterium]